MGHVRRAFCSLILLTASLQPGRAAEEQLSCNGQLIRGGSNPADQSNPIDLNLALDGRKLSVKSANGKPLASHITSNNKVQLKFETKEFVGEYFHFTGDLFLIYHSGQLAKLACSRS